MNECRKRKQRPCVKRTPCGSASCVLRVLVSVCVRYVGRLEVRSWFTCIQYGTYLDYQDRRRYHRQEWPGEVLNEISMDQG